MTKSETTIVTPPRRHRYISDPATIATHRRLALDAAIRVFSPPYDQPPDADFSSPDPSLFPDTMKQKG